jgi:predicted glycosyltransferase
LIGTSVENSHIGKILGIPSINVNEDDHNVVPYYSQLSYPMANTILAPISCTTGRWEHKTIHYRGFHELAYLHPDNFNPRIDIAAQYVEVGNPYFLIRFARLSAHHDKGIRGICDEVALKVIKKLETKGKVYITSEKQLIKKFESYRLQVNPLHMHHVMAFAELYIGDSQTMAAEAGVLGTPFIRFNDFVGRIGYLNEMENYYSLGYGISPSSPEKLFSTIDLLLDLKDLRTPFLRNRQRMLNEKIDVNRFLIWFLENFPRSKYIMHQSPDFQMKFRSVSTEYSTSLNILDSKYEVIKSKLIPLIQA